jgi:alcohol dehydrogenase class IV
MEYNLPVKEEKFAELAKVLGVYDKDKTDLENGKLAIDAIRKFEESVASLSNLPLRLRDVGVTPDTFELIAEKTIVDGTAAYNPREETIEGVIEILSKAY